MSKLERWLTLVANLSVVAGIVFLALQMRQNTAVMQAQTRDSMTEKQMMFSEWIATTPELAEAFRVARSDGLDALDPVQSPMLAFWIQSVFRTWENEYYQYEQGLYTQDEFAPRLIRIARNMAAPMYRQAWESQRETFSPSFRAEIDRIVAEVEQAQ